MSPVTLHTVLFLLFHLLYPSYSLSKEYFADEEPEGTHSEEWVIGPPVESNEIPNIISEAVINAESFPKLCPVLRHPMNAEVSCTNDGSLKTCEQICFPGYKIPSGDDRRTLFCDSTKGWWEPDDDFRDCELPVVTCPELRRPKNSKVACRKFASEKSCTQTCSPGYVLPDGSEAMTLTCHDSTTWWEPLSDFQDCEIPTKKCPDLRHPENAKVSCEPRGTYRICFLECMPGYSLPDGKKEATLTCHKSKGYWDPYSDIPDCEEDYKNGCPTLRRPMNSKMTCNTYGSYTVCEQTCLSGFVLPIGKTRAILTCRHLEGYWEPDGAFQDCEISSSSCPSVRYPENSHLDCEDHDTYKKCVQTCFDGYILPIGTRRKTIICQHSIGWWEPDGDLQDCIVSKNVCPEVRLPRNAKVDCEDHDTYKMCVLTCLPGYELPGGAVDATKICQHSNGWWDPVSEFPDCQAKCNPLCQNGATCIEGNQCVCAKGFRGKRCEQSYDLCSTRDFGNDVIYNCEHRSEYTECTVSCPSGKILIPPLSGVYRCTIDGKWDPKNPPYCVKDDVCEIPPSPKKGYVLCKTVDDSLVCTAHCIDGYLFPDGDDRMVSKCSYLNGGWMPSPGFPDCELAATTSPPVFTVLPTESITLPPDTRCKKPLGLKDGRIAEYQMSASTTYGVVYVPSQGRLGSETAWSSLYLDKKQWLQVDLITQQEISGVITKGKKLPREWVTAFKVLYSEDGEIFKTLGDDDGNPQEFPGNSDHETAVTHMFPKKIRARYLRINPTKWHGWISMQIEVLGCDYNLYECHKPMGLINKKIEDFQLSASTNYATLEAEHGRISSGKSWSSLLLDKKQYLQVDLLEPMVVSAIVTKGRKNAAQWVTAYEVSYSNDGMKWTKIEDSLGIPKEFIGNHDMDSGKINVLPKEIKARFIRIHPLRYYGWISMRVELLGCFERKECREPVSLEDLPDSQITSSSHWPGLETKYSRLSSLYSWSALVNNLEQFIQIDLRKPRKISGVVSKGRGNALQWVKKYKVLTSMDGNKWERVKDSSGSPEVFPGNVDNVSPVINIFDAPVIARYVKIYPLEWNVWISMRLELLGCNES